MKQEVNARIAPLCTRDSDKPMDMLKISPWVCAFDTSMCWQESTRHAHSLTWNRSMLDFSTHLWGQVEYTYGYVAILHRVAISLHIVNDQCTHMYLREDIR